MQPVSYEAKINRLREYTEAIVHYLLDDTAHKTLTLADSSLQSLLDQKGFTEPMFRDSLDTIRKTRNKYSHTTDINITKDDYEQVLDSFFNIYAYLFVNFFKQHSYEDCNSARKIFNAIPPIIRFLTFEELDKTDPGNEEIITQFVYAHYLSFDYDQTMSWLEDHKEALSNVYPLFFRNRPRMLASYIEEQKRRGIHRSLYDRLKDLIRQFDSFRTHKGSKNISLSFEEALKFYENRQYASEQTEEATEFNRLMFFVFEGFTI